MDTSRRNFIKGSGVIAGTAALPLSFSMPANAFSSGIDNDDDSYKALVCVMLQGGNDSFNMLIPTTSSYHADYQAMRPINGFDINQALDINAVSNNGVELGLNPNMPKLKALYEQGLATALINVGTLHEPTTQDSLSSVSLPESIGSHSTQRTQWERSFTRYLGCGGQAMDFLYNEYSPLPAIVHTKSGNWYRGAEAPILSMSSDTSLRMNALDESAELYAIFSDLINQNESSPFGHEINEGMKDSLKLQDDVAEILDGTQEDERIVSGNLGNQLRTVKKFIESAPALGQKRQIFYVAISGYDTHGRNNNTLLKNLDTELCSFIEALKLDGLDESVTTFTVSEFGRTIDENSRGGTDHGWGSVQLVLGGSVNGGKVYGDFPEFSLSGSDCRRRQFIPTLAHEQMLATLGKWFGLNNTSLDYIHPILHPNNDNPFPTRVMDFMRDVGTDNPDDIETELSIASVYASHEHTDWATQIKQVAEMAIDGNVNTKWSGKGLGVVYEASLNAPADLTKLRFRMPKSDIRQYKYVIDVTDENGIEYPISDVKLTPLTDGEYDWFDIQVSASKVSKVSLTYFGNVDSTGTQNEFVGIAQLELWGIA